MTSAGAGAPPWRRPSHRDPISPNIEPTGKARPMSTVLTSPPGALGPTGHGRNHSFSPLNGSNLAMVRPSRQRSNSTRSSNQMSSTFAPKFIKTEELQGKSEQTGGIESEHDFSGKRWVWLRDPEMAFVKGWIVEELDSDRILVQCDDGSVGLFTMFSMERSLIYYSNEKWTGKMLTRSILQSSIRRTIWLNSLI